MPHTLLLADDSVTIQRVIELTFADEDIKVLAVGDGDQAIQRLEAAPPDIVLADIGMPGKNGYEVADYIRQHPKLSHIPVVLLTGAFEPVDQARAAAAGCDGVLAKPFEPQLVIGRVKDLLAKGRSAAAGDDKAAAAPPAAAAPLAPPAAPPPLDDYFDRLDAAFSSVRAPVPPTPAVQPEPVAAPAAEPPPSPLATADIDWFSAAPAPDAAQWDLPASENPPPDFPLAFASPEPSLPEVPAADADTVLLPSSDRQASADSQSSQSHADIVASVPPLTAEFAPPVEEVESPSAVAATPPIAETEPQSAAPAIVASPPPAGPERTATVLAPAATPVLPAVPSTAMPTLGDAFAALLAAEQSDSGGVVDWPGVTHPPAAPAMTDAIIEDIVRRVLERMSDAVVRETTADLVSNVAERLVREEIERIKDSIR